MPNRQPETTVSSIFLERWSPRSFTGEAIPHEELMAMFEAAKWAPSSYNNQPWRFIYATSQNQAAWDKLFNLLGDFNKSWCKTASVLVVVVSKNTFDFNGKPCQTHSFDTGAAWGYLALEAWQRGYAAHGMQGFDYAAAKQALNLNDDYTVEAMIAIGKPDSKEKLSADLQDKEQPSERKSLAQIVAEGQLPE